MGLSLGETSRRVTNVCDASDVNLKYLAVPRVLTRIMQIEKQVLGLIDLLFLLLVLLFQEQR